MAPVSQASKSKRSRRVAGWLAGALIVLSSATAQAEPTFPAIVKEVSHSPCEPQCILCHPTNAPTDLTDAPVYGTRPFYDALFNFGFTSGIGTLRQALLAFAATPVDSNNDGTCDDLRGPGDMPDGLCDVDANQNGVNDIEDLANDLNPNDDTVLCEAPAYGCGASRIEPKGDLDDYGIFLGAFAAMTLLLRTRRRRERR